MKKTLVTGIKPTGDIHIGNYLAVIKPLLDLQNQYNCNVFIADMHALNQTQDKSKLERDIKGTMLAYLASGLDPRKVSLYKQSAIPQVCELAWIFNSLSTMPYLMRAHAFKDAEAKNKEISVGTFTYPLLMAADILLPNAEFVPVGKDQEQHVEISRDMARKFNLTYGEIFKEPRALIKKEVEVVPGINGQKMSKSYNNVIPLFGSEEEIRKIVMSITTDSKSPEESKDPDTNNIFNIHKHFVHEKELEELRKKYTAGGVGYKELKEALFEDLWKVLGPINEKREYWEKNYGKVQKIIKKGSKVAQKFSERKMKEVKEKIGLFL